MINNIFPFIFWISIALILYTYFGYPLILRLLSSIYPKPEWETEKPEVQPLSGRDDDGLPTVTLLIAAYNEADIIAAKLTNSLQLDYPRSHLEIIVTADGSDDHTPAIVKRFAAQGIKLLYRPGRAGKMAAINRAVEFATGEILLFSDANNMYDTKAVRAIVAPFADPKIGGVSGSKKIVKGDGPLGDSEGAYWRYEALIKRMESRIGSSVGAVGEIFAVRASLFEPPPDKIINDDFYMALRLVKRGYRVVYQPLAKSFERVSLSAGDEVMRRSRIISGRYQALFSAYRLLPKRQPIAAWQIVSHKFLRPLVPIAMLLAFLSNLIVVVGGSQGWPLSLTPFGFHGDVMLVLAQLLFYEIALLGKYITGGRMIGKLIYICTFFVNSNWAALKGLMRYFARRESALWERVARRSDPLGSEF